MQSHRKSFWGYACLLTGLVFIAADSLRPHDDEISPPASAVMDSGDCEQQLIKGVEGMLAQLRKEKKNYSEADADTFSASEGKMALEDTLKALRDPRREVEASTSVMLLNFAIQGAVKELPDMTATCAPYAERRLMELPAKPEAKKIDIRFAPAGRLAPRVWQAAL